jgi:hypothetical protein
MLEIITVAAATLGLGSWLALPSVQPWIAALTAIALAPLVPLAMFTLLAETRTQWWRALLVVVLPLVAAGLTLLNGTEVGKFLAVIAGTELLLGLAAGALIAVAGGALQPMMVDPSVTTVVEAT